MMDLLIVPVIFFGLVCYMVGRYRAPNPPNPPEHEHFYVIKNVQNNEKWNTGNPNAKYPYARTSRVLSQCSCGEYVTKEIDGTWKLEDFKPPPAPEAVDPLEQLTALTSQWQNFIDNNNTPNTPNLNKKENNQ